jgi:hypothetical protein
VVYRLALRDFYIMCDNESVPTGAIVAAGVTLGTFAMKTTWGWRIPSALQICPSLLQVLFIWFLPESPRYVFNESLRETYTHAI